jgi:hypothetical protein
LAVSPDLTASQNEAQTTFASSVLLFVLLQPQTDSITDNTNTIATQEFFILRIKIPFLNLSGALQEGATVILTYYNKLVLNQLGRFL